MPDPLPSGYLPLDSNAPPVFREATISDWATFASITVMLYDHVITFDKEVEWIWTLKWRLPKILFLINRYIIPPFVIFDASTMLLYPIGLPACTAFWKLLLWIVVISVATTGALLILRVCALYGHRKLFIRILVGFYALYVIEMIVVASMVMTHFQSFHNYVGLPGCWFLFPSYYFYAFMVPPTVFDGFTMGLTVYKLLQFRGGRTVSLLARDSVVYFIILFSLLMADIIVTFYLGMPVGFTIPMTCSMCIAVSRMAMNVRGLVMEDPGHTTHLRTLGTIKFASAGPDIRLQTLDFEASPENFTVTYPVVE